MLNDDLKFALTQAVEALKNGEAVGIPTETVYGLAADARRIEAVAEIFRIKSRPFFDPLIVHLHSIGQVEEYTTKFPSQARLLAERFWPGPLTILLPRRDSIPDLVTSGLPDVALRIPAHPVALELLRKFDGPLAAPSANKFGRISPTTAEAVREELGQEVRVILDGGPCQVGLESTIVHVAPDGARILRHGGITQEQIEEVIGKVQTAPSIKQNSPLAPGMLDQHYAPRTPLRLLSQEEAESMTKKERKRKGLLCWGKISNDGFCIIRNLSPTESLIEAASHFFQYLRELDQSGVQEIVAVPFPDRDLGRAMNDRLRRGAGQRTEDRE